MTEFNKWKLVGKEVVIEQMSIPETYTFDATRQSQDSTGKNIQVTFSEKVSRITPQTRIWKYEFFHFSDNINKITMIQNIFSLEKCDTCQSEGKTPLWHSKKFCRPPAGFNPSRCIFEVLNLYWSFSGWVFFRKICKNPAKSGWIQLNPAKSGRFFYPHSEKFPAPLTLKKLR